MTDDIFLRSEVYEKLKSYTISSVPQKIKNIMELLKLEAMAEDFPPQPDRIHVANGTLMLDGRFAEGKRKSYRAVCLFLIIQTHLHLCFG